VSSRGGIRTRVSSREAFYPRYSSTDYAQGRIESYLRARGDPPTRVHTATARPYRLGVDSSSLAEHGLTEWVEFGETAYFEPRRWLGGVPRWPGVYALRRSSSFPRLRGTTDLVYIGCAGDLRQRIGAYSTLVNLGTS
jgi:hypothetical protein